MLIGILITAFLITFIILHSGMDVIFSSYFIKLLFALKKKRHNVASEHRNSWSFDTNEQKLICALFNWCLAAALY